MMAIGDLNFQRTADSNAPAVSSENGSRRRCVKVDRERKLHWGERKVREERGDATCHVLVGRKERRTNKKRAKRKKMIGRGFSSNWVVF